MSTLYFWSIWCYFKWNFFCCFSFKNKDIYIFLAYSSTWKNNNVNTRTVKTSQNAHPYSTQRAASTNASTTPTPMLMSHLHCVYTTLRRMGVRCVSVCEWEGECGFSFCQFEISFCQRPPGELNPTNSVALYWFNLLRSRFYSVWGDYFLIS